MAVWLTAHNCFIMAESNEEPLRDIVAILRTEVENQAKVSIISSSLSYCSYPIFAVVFTVFFLPHFLQTIESLTKTMAMYEVERIHNHNYVAFLQGQWS